MRAILMVYPNGSIKHIVVPCGKWKCPICSQRRAEELVEHISEASQGADLFMLQVSGHDWDKVRKMAAREYANYLAVKRWGRSGEPGDVLIVADTALSGRGWALKPVESNEQVVDVVLSEPVRRTDWSQEWRREKPERGKLIGRVSCPPRLANQVLHTAGYDPKLGCIPGMTAAEAAAQIADALDVLGDAQPTPKVASARKGSRS